MKVVYVPDVVNVGGLGVEVGCLCSLSSCECVRRGVPTFVDVGLAGAKYGVDFGRYIRLVQRVSAVVDDVYAVVPDAFCDAEMTIRNWKRWARHVKRYAKTVLVLQRFYEDVDKYSDVIQEADLVALPSRYHCDAYCLERPRLCAERIGRVVDLSVPECAHAYNIFVDSVGDVYVYEPQTDAIMTVDEARRDCKYRMEHFWVTI